MHLNSFERGSIKINLWGFFFFFLESPENIAVHKCDQRHMKVNKQIDTARKAERGGADQQRSY